MFANTFHKNFSFTRGNKEPICKYYFYSVLGGLHMKTTGIVRRVDEMGRIVIPKEIRHAYRLKDGDPMEFFIEDNNVVMQKFDGVLKGDMVETASPKPTNGRRAIYAGSFDPFTNAHLALVNQASKLFDELTIAIGVNSTKTRYTSVEAMIDAIKSMLYENNLENCDAVFIDGAIATYCMESNIKYSVRMLRENMDLYYESEINRINKLINPNLETVYISSNGESISSAIVRDLIKCDLPVYAYVPESVLDILLK